MYLPRSLISKLYTHLQTTRHPTSPPVLILVALEPDALCGCRILTRLLKHDYIPHKIQPVAGYSDLEKAGKELVMPMMESQGGSGGVVVCLGVGGMVDLGPLLGLEQDGAEAPYSGVEVWVIDARRPWNLGNVFGGFPLEATSEAESSYQSRTPVGISGGQVERAYKSGKGGIVVFDDGDIEEAMEKERDAGLVSLRGPEAGLSSDAIEPPSAAQEPPPPSARALRRRLLRLRQEKEAVLHSYYRMGSSFAEPISSMMYSLASELGRDDNDLLWLTIVGVTSMELYGRSSAGTAAPIRSNDSSRPSGWMGVRGARLRQLLRDEVRRLNPPEVTNGRVAPENAGVIPTTARNPEDTGIRLSPEPRFLLIRHWSLYDSMLHSPYLFSRLKTWSETGIKRLHKLLAKMGVSLAQCKQSYTHMDMMLKRELRAKLLKYGSLYNLDEMVPAVDTDDKDRAGAKDGWGFVRSWGWRATLSAQDVGVVIGALLEVGKHVQTSEVAMPTSQLTHDAEDEVEFAAQAEEWVGRFWEAYDALEDIDSLKAGLPTAQFLHRAIYRTGTSLINKKQIKHLRAFRMCVVKDGPDVALFTHPAALTKLSLWIGEALAEQEREAHGKLSHGGRGTPLVVASLNEKRSVYVDSGDDDDAEPDKGYGLNKFGSAFQEVVSETNARVRIDSFEHCAVEVRKEDLGGFLESLSMKAVVG
ncbi:Cell division control protein 45 [Metarhizium anisopliae]